MYEVLKEQKINISICRDANRVFIIGGWSTGMIGVSKTFGRGSIPLPPEDKQCIKMQLLFYKEKLNALIL